MTALAVRVWRTVAALTADVAALEARIAALEAERGRRRPVDSAADQRLLSEIARLRGSTVFSGAELIALAAEDPALAAAIAGADARGVGAGLVRLHRQPRGPYVVRRVGRDATGIVWALDLAVSAPLHTRPCPTPPRRAR
jgi:hypothetical protein